jgi:hypothetical protein
MAEKNEIAIEVCRDHQENNPPVRWQKQVSNSKGDSPEIASRSNSHIQEKGVRSIFCINIAFISAQSIAVRTLNFK